MEAVFRDMIRDVPGLMGPYEVAFCLEAPGKTDPPAPVMNRLRDSAAKVIPASACRIELDGRFPPEFGVKRMVELASGADAIMLQVDSIDCSDERHCSVVCGYFARSLSASSNTFEVEKRDEEWIVTSRQMLWIS
jgi:hypothetical protein